MVKKLLILVFLVLLVFFCEAQITSTFDSGDEGWTFSAAITHNSNGGNTGGFISSTYSANATSTAQYWSAPSKFLGGLAVRSLGEYLTFSMQQSHTGTANISFGDVRIENGGSVIIFQLPTKPALAPAWSTYTVKLDETAGWKWSSGGADATREQIIQVLSNVTAIEFRASYITNASYTSGIDDVSIGQKTLATAPVITSFSPIAALPGTSVTISGNDFDPVAANNVVYFGPVAAQVISASATQLVVDVPPGATYGPIEVINTTKRLSARSLQPFTPLFIDGGRIIPCSFDRKLDINTSVDIGGIAISDIDGDGWGDIVIADDRNNNFKVYRHKGVGGDLTGASFEDEVSFATGGSSTNGAGLRAVDLDGDGKPDVVVTANRSSTRGTFVTFRNTSTPGTISFEAPERWDGLSDETPLLNVVDIDGDGRPDLMGCEGSSSSTAAPYFWIAQNISVAGDIEFAASRNFDFDQFTAVSGASVGDLDNDGKADIVVKANFSGEFHILKNNSTPGVLNFEYLFEVSSPVQGGVQIADLNLDGKNDLIWKSNGTNDVIIRLNGYTNGTLSADDFSTQVILYSDLGNYGGASLGDINGDGKIDIVVADNGNIGIFENVYSGGVFNASAFVSAYLFEGSGGSTYPTSVICADLNRDHKPDMITGVTGPNPNRISIYENRNYHSPEISLNTVSPLSGPVGSSIVITGNYFSVVASENKVYFGAVQATVTSATKTQLTVTVPPGATYAPVSVRVGELTSRYHLPFNVTFSSGVSFDDTHFAPPVSFVLTTANYDIDVADLDGDGKPDVIAEASGGTYAFRNTHLTGAISNASLTPDDTIPSSFTNPRIEDLDGDGLPDVVAINGVMRKNQSTNGEIAFAANTSFGGGGSNLTFGDFNRDGKMDLTYTNGAQLIIKENRSLPGNFTTGNFATLSSNFTFTKLGGGGGIATGDFDGDGYTDVAVTNPSTDNVSFFRNLGGLKISNAQFDTRVDLVVGDNPVRIYSGDLDVDGKLDLVMYHNAGTSATSITVLHNQSTPGSIVFNSFTLTLPANGTVAHIDDLDGDGKPEILVVSEAGDVFTIFKNNASPGILTASSFAAPFNTSVANPRCIYTADINLDGKPEILITSAPNALLVYENLVPNVSITITAQPPAMVTACEGQPVTLAISADGPAPLSYQWQKYDGTAFVDLTDDAVYNGAETAELLIQVTSANVNGTYRCWVMSPSAVDVFSAESDVTVSAVPAAPSVTDGSVCGSGEILLVAEGGTDGSYRWYDADGNLLSGEVNHEFMTPELSVTTSFFVALTNGMCESAHVQAVATVDTVPSPPDVTDVTVCIDATATITASGGSNGNYRWYTTPSGGEIIQNEFNENFITSSLAETTRYFVSIVSGNCESSRSEVTVSVTDCSDNVAPVISPATLTTQIGGTVTLNLLSIISDGDDDLAMNTLQITVQPSSGATATIDAQGNLVLDYSAVTFSGVDHLTIRVCDAVGLCTEQIITVDVSGELMIYNAVSPNGDGLNDAFTLRYIDAFEDTRRNTVHIYNRWGDLVFEAKDYDNNTVVFKGLNKNGKALPSGVYFYKVEFVSGHPAKSGYLLLKH